MTEESGDRRGQTRWSRWHEASLHKNAKKAPIHLHLSLLILALTFQNWQVKSSAGVWWDAMQGRQLNRALTAFDRYHVYALSHQTWGRGRYSLFPRAHHAMPLWPVWACVHKQTSGVTGNHKCRPKVGLWLITPYLRSMHTTEQHLPPWNNLITYTGRL